MARELGLPLVEEKTEGPTSTLTFLRIELDTPAQTCHLPHSKLCELRKRLGSFIGKKKFMLRELQEIMGHLNFACTVVAPRQGLLA